jgi:hypothetical protein
MERVYSTEPMLVRLQNRSPATSTFAWLECSPSAFTWHEKVVGLDDFSSFGEG